MSSNCVVKKEWTQSGGSTSKQTGQYLQLFPKTFLWGAWTQFYPNICLKITQSIFSRVKKIQDNHITKFCAVSARLLSICVALNNWKKKLQYVSYFLSIKLMDRAPISSKESSWKFFFVEDLLTLNIFLYDIDISDGNIVEEFARRSAQKYENTVRLLRQQPHMLREQH